MNQVKNVVEPVCKLVQSNKAMLSNVLVVLVVFLMLPVDRLLRTNVKGNLVSNLKNNMGMVTSCFCPSLSSAFISIMISSI